MSNGATAIYQAQFGGKRECYKVVPAMPIGGAQLQQLRKRCLESIEGFIAGYEAYAVGQKVPKVTELDGYINATSKDNWYNGYVDGWRLAAMEYEAQRGQ